MITKRRYNNSLPNHNNKAVIWSKTLKNKNNIKK